MNMTLGLDMSSSTLNHLRQTLAGLDPTLGPRFSEAARNLTLGKPIDSALSGGLACGSLHELAPVAPIHLGAASGFTVALASLAAQSRGEILWITTDFAIGEGGGLYGPGLDLFGLPSNRLLMLRVSRPADVLWAMEEALRCGALACAIAELTGDGAAADLTATRRLSLAVREGAGGSGLGLLIRHRATPVPTAAATCWQIAAVSSRPDGYGGLGRARFELFLRKNRRGPSGRWIVEWDHHEHVFQQAISVDLAKAAVDRPHRTAVARTG
jgi:protein ImuA